MEDEVFFNEDELDVEDLDGYDEDLDERETI
jgi:hypothetical protein